jgi:RimJ/RimL family protein N-acetyltransferase
VTLMLMTAQCPAAGARAHGRRDGGGVKVAALLRRAAAEPDAHTVRVTISPNNVTSRRLASHYGFSQIGERWERTKVIPVVTDPLVITWLTM